MAKRKALTKKTRFEVFKRDKFTCQYCGDKAPETVLHVDHIIAVANGGDNAIMNLVTACQSCNAGKSARPLSDETTLQKQRQTLEDIAVRREQLEMMAQWRTEILALGDVEVEFFIEQLKPYDMEGYSLNDEGKKAVRSWVKTFKMEELLEALSVSAETYLEDENGKITDKSWSKFFEYIPRIAHSKRRFKGDEEFWKQVFYIRAILKNRFHMTPWRLNESKNIIMKLLQNGSEFEREKDFAQRAGSYTRWVNTSLEELSKAE